MSPQKLWLQWGDPPLGRVFVNVDAIRGRVRGGSFGPSGSKTEDERLAEVLAYVLLVLALRVRKETSENVTLMVALSDGSKVSVVAARDAGLLYFTPPEAGGASMQRVEVAHMAPLGTGTELPQLLEANIGGHYPLFEASQEVQALAERLETKDHNVSLQVGRKQHRASITPHEPMSITLASVVRPRRSLGGLGNVLPRLRRRLEEAASSLDFRDVLKFLSQLSQDAPRDPAAKGAQALALMNTPAQQDKQSSFPSRKALAVSLSGALLLAALGVPRLLR